MKGRTWIWAVVLLAGALFGTWIARHTYWDDLKVPMPPKGEALVNPFYATQRFAGTLGARTSRWRSSVAGCSYRVKADMTSVKVLSTLAKTWGCDARYAAGIMQQL